MFGTVAPSWLESSWRRLLSALDCAASVFSAVPSSLDIQTSSPRFLLKHPGPFSPPPPRGDPDLVCQLVAGVVASPQVHADTRNQWVLGSLPTRPLGLANELDWDPSPCPEYVHSTQYTVESLCCPTI